MTIRRTILLAAITAAVALAGGCTTTETTSMSPYASTTPSDEFEKGRGRPPSAETLFRMGNVLAAQEKTSEAAAVFRSSIRLHPDFTPAYAELAALQIRHQAVEPAIETLNAALAIDPQDATLMNNLGMALMLLERYDEAAFEFERARTADPDNMRYAANLALATGLVRQYDEALEMYMEFMFTRRAHHNVGVIAEANGDFERARKEFALAQGRVVIEPAAEEETPVDHYESEHDHHGEMHDMDSH